MQQNYQLVQLANGSYSLRSLDVGETFHPVIGPVAEAEALYVGQLRLRERLVSLGGRMTVWDVGLGAAANILTALRHLSGSEGWVKVLSFDHSLEPLRFALEHGEALGYFGGFEDCVARLLAGDGVVNFELEGLGVEWEVKVGDFPTLLGGESAGGWAKPGAILFDAFSPRKNPDMWTQPLFQRLAGLMDEKVPCALATYSRSTQLRVSLLLAGLWVGSGEATGEKEETTLAANDRRLVPRLLDGKWLERASRSTSAEPLWTGEYRQSRLSAETWERLRMHPQFTEGQG